VYTEAVAAEHVLSLMVDEKPDGVVYEMVNGCPHKSVSTKVNVASVNAPTSPPIQS
jgi:hypothetical protein